MFKFSEENPREYMYNMNEMKRLHEKAANFCKSSSATFAFTCKPTTNTLHRDKSKAYFDNIQDNHNNRRKKKSEKKNQLENNNFDQERKNLSVEAKPDD